MVKKTTTVYRAEMFTEVWEPPMSRLSEKYGVSDVGLKKICKKS